MTAATRKKTRYEYVYTTVEFARLFACSIRKVQKLCEQGRAHKGVDSYRVGERGLRIPKTELDRLLKESATADLNHAAPDCVGSGDLT